MRHMTAVSDTHDGRLAPFKLNIERMVYKYYMWGSLLRK